MSPQIRLGLLVIFLGALPELGLRGQIPPGTPDNPPLVSAAPRFIPERDARPLPVLEAIEEHLPDGRWERIIPALQSVIDRGAVLLPETMGNQTCREAGLALLARLPEAGKAYYRERYEPIARELLDRGRRNGDADALLELLRRFAGLPSAESALESLVTALAEQNREAEAVGAVRRLLPRKPLGTWSAEELWRATRAAVRTGSEGLARELEPQLLKAVGDGAEIDGKKRTRAEIEAELERLRERPAGSVPLPVATWSEAATTFAPLREVLEEAAGALRRKREMVPGAAGPVAARFRIEGKERDVLVVRGPEGVRCLEAETGKVFWQVAMAQDLGAWLRDPARAAVARRWVSSHGTNKKALFDNTRTGQVSVADGRVCLVEDVSLLAGVNVGPVGFVGQPPVVPDAVQEILQRNRLVCIDGATGKVLWETGGNRDDLHGWFLGAPLLMGSVVVALHEKDRELRLVQLDARTGKVILVRALGQMGNSLSNGEERRRGLRLVASEGILLVPTGLGALLGLHLPHLDQAWLYEYGEAPARPNPFIVPNVAAKSGPGLGYEPQVVGDLVIYSGPDTQRIHGMELLTGKVRWAVPIQEGDRQVTPAGQEGILVTGTGSLRLLEPGTGKIRWKVEAVPSSSGMVVGTRWVQPVHGDRGSELLVLDLLRGTEVQRVTMPAGLVGSSLYPVGGATVAIGPGGVAYLPGMEMERGRLEKQVAAGGGEALAARVRLAEIERQLGQSEAALTGIRKVLADRPEAEVLRAAREQLFQILVDRVRQNPDSFAEHGEELSRLANVEVSPDVPAEAQKALKAVRSRRQRQAFPVLVAGYFRAKKPLPAAELVLELAAEEDGSLLPGEVSGHLRTVTAQARQILRSCLVMDREGVLKLLGERLRRPGGEKLLGALPVGTAADALLLERAVGMPAREGGERERLLVLLAQDGRVEEAARALEEWQRQALKEGRWAEAVELARWLARRHDRKEPLDRLKEEPRAAAFLTPAKAPQKWTATEGEGIAPGYSPGPLLPHPTEFAGADQWLQVNATGTELGIVRRGEVRPEVWVKLPASQVLSEINLLLYGRLPLRYQRVGRDLLVPLGEHLICLEEGTNRIRWSENLAGEGFRPPAGMGPTWVNYSAGWYALPLDVGKSLIKGAPVATFGGIVATVSLEGVVGLDLGTGKVVWRRRDLDRSSLLLSAGPRLLVAEINGARCTKTHWLSLEDGGSAEENDLSAELNDSVQFSQGRLIIPSRKKPVVNVVGLSTGLSFGEKEMPAGSRVLTSRSAEVFGWVEPSGTVRILDVETLKERATGELEAKAREISGGAILVDRTHWYVTTLPQKPNPAHSTSSSHEPVGQALVQNFCGGNLLALSRETGKPAWQVAIPGLFVGIGADGEVPLVVAQAARYQLMGTQYVPETVLQLIDRRTGKLVFEKTYPKVIRGVLSVRWNPGTATLELQGSGFGVSVKGE